MISWQAVRGGGGKQAFYFQVTHRGERGVGGWAERERQGRRLGQHRGFKYLMCYYLSINIKPIKTCIIDELYF